jgi:hypothetical protein
MFFRSWSVLVVGSLLLCGASPVRAEFLELTPSTSTTGPCSLSTFAGTYYYLLSGAVASGSQTYPYAELGKLIVDGQGHVSGQSHASNAGSLGTYSLAGTYTVQGNCTGTMNLTVNSMAESPITFQIVDSGEEVIVAFSDPNAVVSGEAYREATVSTSSQCGPASFSGTYGYLLTGMESVSGQSYYYADAGAVTSDGKGNINTTSVVNANGSSVSTTGTGSYSIAGDCSGTAQVVDQNGTINYIFAVVDGGQGVLFLATNSGYTVAGEAQPQLRLTVPRLRVIR